VLQWIRKNSKRKHTEPEIAAWSAYQEQRASGDIGSRGFFHELHGKIAPRRDDISTWFDLLDVDDYVSFGGKA